MTTKRDIENRLELDDELEEDEVIAEALGEHVSEKFVEAKSQEYDEFRIDVSQWELDRYLEKY